VISSPTACTVAQLLNAQRICLGWNEEGGLSIDGHRLSLRTILDSMSGPYQLLSENGARSRPTPPGTFAVGLQHGSEFHMVFLRAGQFLFEALRPMGINEVNFLVDIEGKVYGADFRVWKSLNLRTLDPTSLPPSFTIRAAGFQALPEGLHDDHISWTLQRFIQHIPDLLRPLVIFPITASHLLNGFPASTLALGAAFSKSDDRIFCIFPHASHWAWLWGQLYVDHLRWQYCDGLPGQATYAATHLAALISAELSLDWAIEPGHLFTQQDDHTCGSIALLHVGALLGLPTREAILDFHAWLQHRPALGLLNSDLTS